MPRDETPSTRTTADGYPLHCHLNDVQPEAYLREVDLRKLVMEFVAHYHAELNQGLGNKLVVPMNDNATNGGRVVRRQRLGGVLNSYFREAA